MKQQETFNFITEGSYFIKQGNSGWDNTKKPLMPLKAKSAVRSGKVSQSLISLGLENRQGWSLLSLLDNEFHCLILLRQEYHECLMEQDSAGDFWTSLGIDVDSKRRNQVLSEAAALSEWSERGLHVGNTWFSLLSSASDLLSAFQQVTFSSLSQFLLL